MRWPCRLMDAKEQNKFVICPFNPGFAGLAMCFDKNSPSIHNVFDTSVSNMNDMEIAKQLFSKYPQMNTLNWAHKTSATFLEEVSRKGYFPQVTIGSLLTAGIVLRTMLKFLEGEKIKTAPEIIYVDCES